MCFGGGGGGDDGGAAEQQAKLDAKEAKRQVDIKAGQANIDTAFSQFDPAYYDKFKGDYTGYYTPQIADQYSTAKDKLAATLAGRGTLDSTVGAAKFSELDKTRADSEADIGNRSADEANNLKKSVEDTKTNLYQINQSAADPTGISAQAIGQASAIAAPKALSPLGQVFASVLQPLGTYNKADATSMSPKIPWNQNAGYTAPLSGRGSSLIG